TRDEPSTVQSLENNHVLAEKSVCRFHAHGQSSERSASASSSNSSVVVSCSCSRSNAKRVTIGSTGLLCDLGFVADSRPRGSAFAGRAAPPRLRPFDNTCRDERRFSS